MGSEVTHGAYKEMPRYEAGKTYKQHGPPRLQRVRCPQGQRRGAASPARKAGRGGKAAAQVLGAVGPGPGVGPGKIPAREGVKALAPTGGAAVPVETDGGVVAAVVLVWEVELPLQHVD